MNYLQKIYKDLQTCLLVNNDLCRKLTSSFALPIIFGDVRTVIPDSFFASDSNISCCEFDSFKFTLWYWVTLYLHYMKQNKFVIASLQ